MSSWWVSDILAVPGGTVILVSWVVWVIGSIVLHELGHGWAALACGDDTPRDTGHMTWNPVVHMGWPSLLVFAIIGIAWGAMPVNPARFRGRFDDALVSLAGPMMNVLLATAALLLNCVWIAGAGGYWLPIAVPDAVFSNVQVFLTLGVKLNIVLALFNLLPVPPLDGSRVIGAFVPAFRAFTMTPAGMMVGLVAIVLLFSRGGPIIFDVAGRVSERSTHAVLRVVAPGALPSGGGAGGPGSRSAPKAP